MEKNMLTQVVVCSCVTGPQIHKLTRAANMVTLKKLLDDADAPADALLYYAALIAFVALKRQSFGM